MFKVVITCEVEPDHEIEPSFEKHLIERDIMSEISSCWHSPENIQIMVEDINQMEQDFADLANISDKETRHRAMDRYMEELLDSLGYSYIKKIFEKTNKWYS